MKKIIIGIVMSMLLITGIAINYGSAIKPPHPPHPTKTPSPSPTITPSPSPSPSISPSPTSTPDAQPSFPIRATFYYPWFPETWGDGTVYHPSLGRYDSSSSSVIASHISSMQYAGIDAAIASWWGQGTKTDQRIPQLLAANGSSPLRWTLYYEKEGYADPSTNEINSDLTYIYNNYANNPGYLRVNGRPVIFVYGSGTDNCTLTDRWVTANAERFYLVLKVFSGYRTCATQPSSWHQYGPAVATDSQLPYSYSVSPGFWKYGESSPRLVRDTNRFAQNIQNMVASNAEWQLITTFNEWGEGTAIEPASEWGNTYLDILKNNGVLASPTVTLTPPPTTTTPPPTTTTPPPGTFLVAAAGDICGGCQATANEIIARNPPLVLTLGDNAYTNGTLSEYLSKYAPYWGIFKAKTQPTAGNHEYNTSNAQGYRDYFGYTATAPLYGSYNYGGWHFIKMDTTKMSSTQVSWISNDLAADNSSCEIAYGHHPRWSSGTTHGSQTSQDAVWKAEAAAGVDLVLVGHEHNYERFGLINGMREFVVGTGGESHYAFGTPITGSEIRIPNIYGVLFLTLGPGAYSWQFISTSNVILDSGTGTCH